MFRQLQTKTTIIVRNVIITSVVGIGVLEITTHLPSQGRSSKFYHSVCDDVIVPNMRRFITDPEVAHNIAIKFTQYGLSPIYRPSAEEQTLKDISIKPFLSESNLKFTNCIGLAAGFDKDGVIIKEMLQLGFSFVEIGSVTPKPQRGNPTPRMFRLVGDKGIINRYGFNSLGVEAVKNNLMLYRGIIPIVEEDSEGKEEEGINSDEKKDAVEDEEEAVKEQNSKKNTNNWQKQISRMMNGIVSSLTRGGKGNHNGDSGNGDGLVGVNLGKNKDSDNEIEDYKIGIRELGPYADYLVINISSPNTPGLRDLQYGDRLRNLLEESIKERNILEEKPPLLVKLAPDLTYEELKLITQTLLECNIDGIIVTNTTLSRPSSLVSPPRITQEVGGLSGKPIRDMSTNCIKQIYELTSGGIPIIGVGGVGSGRDVYDKLRAGASLVQIYSMMIYEGPGLITRIRHELASIMHDNGHSTLSDIIGLDHPEIYWKKRLKEQQEEQEQEKSN